MSARTDLRSRLRVATEAAHERMHLHSGFRGAANGSLTLAEYRDLLARLYGFHEAFDAAFPSAPAAFAGAIDLGARARSEALARDLTALGLAPRISSLPRCATAPRPLSEPQWLGALYVTEGSTLGGAQIARALATMGIGEDGRRFFTAYGELRSGMWRLFLSRLETWADDPEASDAVETAAVAAFESFEVWMRDWVGAAER